MLRLSAIPVLAGPTASGKTAMALQLAQAFPLEVISADASMVYRGMDIGTAKPSPAEQAQLPHHLLDVVEPDQPFSVSDYLAQAQQSIAQVLAHGRIPLVVGGTGYYIRALSEGLFQVPEPDPALQEEIWAELNAKGIDALEAELYRASPADVLRVERNPRRLVRAIEVLRRSGAPPVRAEKIEPAYRYSKLIFWPQWEWLEPRLKARIEAMFAQGLVAEVERLLHRYPTMPTAFQAIGYKEVAAHLRGGCSLDQAKALVLKATRAYAKRQFTWFRKEPGTVRRLEMNQDVLVQAKEWLYQLQVDVQP